MNFVEAIKSGFSNYVNFSSRACRSEYWFWALFAAIGGIATYIIDLGIGMPITRTIFSLATFLPGLAVAVRRLHDLDRTGWWLLLVLVPLVLAGIVAVVGANTVVMLVLIVLYLIVLVGSILLIVWFCTKGTEGPNRFGADPLAAVPSVPRPQVA